MAKITGVIDGKIQREFLRPKKDYSASNGAGSRGIMLNYIIDEDVIYEVNERISWARTRRYFLRYTNGVKETLTKEQVLREADAEPEYFEPIDCYRDPQDGLIFRTAEAARIAIDRKQVVGSVLIDSLAEARQLQGYPAETVSGLKGRYGSVSRLDTQREVYAVLVAVK